MQMLMSANEQRPSAVYYPVTTAHIIQHDDLLAPPTKSTPEECLSAEICAAVVGTPTVPPNYTCLVVREGAGLMPAAEPGCET